MPDFDVGRPELNELLDWVDQPPAQGRDTHAVSFVLRRDFQRGPFYAGLMFYHRGLSPTAGSFQRQHGLSGVAKKVMNEANCEKNFQLVGQPAQEFDGHEHVLVELRFRMPSDLLPPAQIFLGLQFFKGAGRFGLLLGTEVPSVPPMDSSPLRVSPTIEGPLTLSMFPEDGRWALSSLEKTTVLFRPM